MLEPMVVANPERYSGPEGMLTGRSMERREAASFTFMTVEKAPAMLEWMRLSSFTTTSAGCSAASFSRSSWASSARRGRSSAGTSSGALTAHPRPPPPRRRCGRRWPRRPPR